MPLSSFVRPPDIITNYTGHIAARDARIAEFEAHCPLVRPTTFYIDQISGNDSNSGTTPQTAWQTRLKAIQEESGRGPNVAYLFCRGREWVENDRWCPTNTGITIADYGDTNLDFPFWNAFTIDFTNASFTGVSGTNAYQTATPFPIAGLREKNDRFGETRGITLALMSSTGSVTGTANSFYWASNRLFVNLNGDNPNTVDLEGAIADSGLHTTVGRHGLMLNKDGSRGENIRADGFGVSLVGDGSQIQTFTSQTTGNDAVYFKNCYGYYGSTHVMAHWSNYGGKSMWNGCRGGFAHSNTSTTSFLNCFTASGNDETGPEFWSIDCAVEYGQRPGIFYLPTGTGSTLEGVGIIAHTTVGNIVWEGVYNFTVENTYHPAVMSVSLDNCVTGNIVVDNLLVKKPLHPRHTSGAWPILSSAASGIIHRSKMYFWPRAGTTQLTVFDAKQTQSNSYIEADLSALGNNNFGLFNNTTSGAARWDFFHTFFNITGSTATNANRFGLDFDSRGNSSPPGFGFLRNSHLYNSIVAYSNADSDAMVLGFTNTNTGLINNAYYQVRNSGTTEDRHYGNTANLVLLTGQPTLNVIDSRLMPATMSGTTYMPVHSVDINAKPRINLSTPHIGPNDFSAPNNIVEPSITGTFYIGTYAIGNSGLWSDGTGTLQFRKAVDATGGSASNISSATGSTYLISSGDMSASEYLGLRITYVNLNGTTIEDSPWYLIYQSGSNEQLDIISIDGSDIHYQGITVNTGGNIINTTEKSVSIVEFNLSRYSDRFNDRTYYRRNRTP